MTTMRTVLKFAKLAQALRDAQSGWTKVNRPRCDKCGGVAVWQHKGLMLYRCARCPRNESTAKAGAK